MFLGYVVPVYHTRRAQTSSLSALLDATVPAGPQVTLQPRRPPPRTHQHFTTLCDLGPQSLLNLLFAPYTYVLPPMVLVFHRQQAPL